VVLSAYVPHSVIIRFLTRAFSLNSSGGDEDVSGDVFRPSFTESEANFLPEVDILFQLKRF
jgi:hypothetical protein